jgi:hypothetical protein
MGSIKKELAHILIYRNIFSWSEREVICDIMPYGR